MKFQPREHRVSVEIDDVSSLPKMYSRRTLPFFFSYQELFCDFNRSRVRKGRMRSGACLRLEFCLTGLPVLRGASCLPPHPPPHLFFIRIVLCCVFSFARLGVKIQVPFFLRLPVFRPRSLLPFRHSSVSVFWGVFFCSSLVFVFCFELYPLLILLVFFLLSICFLVISPELFFLSSNCLIKKQKNVKKIMYLLNHILIVKTITFFVGLQSADLWQRSFNSTKSFVFMFALKITGAQLPCPFISLLSVSASLSLSVSVSLEHKTRSLVCGSDMYAFCVLSPPPPF